MSKNILKTDQFLTENLVMTDSNENMNYIIISCPSFFFFFSHNLNKLFCLFVFPFVSIFLFLLHAHTFNNNEDHRSDSINRHLHLRSEIHCERYCICTELKKESLSPDTDL